MFDTHDWSELTHAQYAAGSVDDVPARLEYIPEEINVTDLENFIQTMCEYYRQVYEYTTMAYQEQKEAVDGEFEKYKALCGGDESQSCVNAEITMLRNLRLPADMERGIREEAKTVKEGDCIDLDGYRNIRAWYVYKDMLGRLAVSRMLDDYGYTLPREAWPMYLIHGEKIFEKFQNAEWIQMDLFSAAYVNGTNLEKHPQYLNYLRNFKKMRFVPLNCNYGCDSPQDWIITDNRWSLEGVKVRGELSGF